MNLTLVQRPIPREAAPPVTAWFLAGASAARWLEELARCGLADAGTRLFLVPRSLSDRSPSGLLVVPEDRRQPVHPPAGLPCRTVADRLFVPLEADLEPPVTDAEVRQLCPVPVTFCHPALGLSGFGDESTLRIWDLVELPEERPECWNGARAGDPPLPSLQAVVLARPPTVEGMFGDARQGIGTEDPKELPPVPGEPQTGPAASAGRSFKRAVARIVEGITRRVPHIGRRRTWVNDLEDWARAQLRVVQEPLEHSRSKELHRLLHLLRNDPEAGLRHAIPMNTFAHRGLSAPGRRLKERNPDFDPRRLGGAAADFWAVPFDLQEQLRRMYREMAGRELRLGRHRRAAYIFAELLGDLASSANAFKQGGWFREAALLYEEHLANPREAAHCLAEGGLLHEAIERYEKLGLWLEVADLQERLGNRAGAVAALRRVVEEKLAQRDLLGAAKLMDERLQEPDEALVLLWSAWPAERQAVLCLNAAFRLLGRLGRHGDAEQCLAQLRREPGPPLLTPEMLAMLGEVTRSYPTESLREQAADLSRVLIARRLHPPGPRPREAAALMQHLQALVPQDRLLARDTNRHLAAHRAADLARERQLASARPAAGKTPTEIRRLELRSEIRWVELQNEGPWFFALGVGGTPNRLTLARGNWRTTIQMVSWDCEFHLVKHGFVLEPAGDQGRTVAVATIAGPPLPERVLPAVDIPRTPECRVGMPAWLPPEARPFSLGTESAWSAHVAAGQAILSCYDRRGVLLNTLEVTRELLDEAERGPAARLCLAAWGEAAAVALGNRLLVTVARPSSSSSANVERFDLPGQALRICRTIRHTRPGVVITLEHGAVLHWIGSQDWIELDRDLAAPLCAFVHGGPVVLVSGQQGLLLEVDQRGVQSLTRFAVACRQPVGIANAGVPGQFGVLDANGGMRVYQVPH